MRFVVCGEALIDIFPDEGPASGAESRWRALSGGGPMNTAVALAKLDCDVSFLGRFGDDAFAAQLRKHITDHGVRLDQAVATQDATSLAVVSLAEDGKAFYTFHFAGTANFGWQAQDFPVLSEGDWLHFGSIGAVIDPGAEALARFVENTQATLSYDINVRLGVLPNRAEYWSKVARLLSAVGLSGGLAKASDDDIRILVDDPLANPIEFALDWASEFGLALFVVTLGSDGAAAVKPDGRVFRVPGHVIELVDTVGAGDTFMAGFLAAYVERPDDIEAALRQGAGASALVCARQGAKPPTRAELDELLA